MGSRTGLVLIAVGAVLSWAVDVDLPFVQDDALGALLLLAGVVVLVAGSVAHAGSSPVGAGTGVGLLLAGAILFWALEVDLPFLDIDALGIVLLVAGAVTVGASVFMTAQHSRSQNVVEYRYK